MNQSITTESEIIINNTLVSKKSKKTKAASVSVSALASEVSENIVADTMICKAMNILGLEKVVKVKMTKEEKEQEKIIKDQEKVNKDQEKANKLALKLAEKTVLLESKNAEKLAKKEALAVAKQSKKDAIIMENEVEETDEPDDDLIPEVKPILEDVLAFAYSLLNEMYEKGKDLTGTPLKVFSGEALETFSKQIIERCFTVIGIENGKVNQNYLSDPENILDDQRLDQHVYIGDKIVLMQEDRAWVDKPFYTLKRGVIEDIMKLPFCLEKMHPSIKFVILSYTVDVTQKTKITQDQTKGYGNIVTDFSINSCRRGLFKNWYEGGYSKKNVKQYIKFVVTHLHSLK